MSRKAVLEGGKRDEILNAALELFLKTDMRLLLSE